MYDRCGALLSVGDIVLTVKGLNLSKYRIAKLAVPLQLEEVDQSLKVIKQPRGKKYRMVHPRDCVLSHKRHNIKYVKV